MRLIYLFFSPLFISTLLYAADISQGEETPSSLRHRPSTVTSSDVVSRVLFPPREEDELELEKYFKQVIDQKIKEFDSEPFDSGNFKQFIPFYLKRASLIYTNEELLQSLLRLLKVSRQHSLLEEFIDIGRRIMSTPNYREEILLGGTLQVQDLYNLGEHQYFCENHKTTKKLFKQVILKATPQDHSNLLLRAGLFFADIGDRELANTALENAMEFSHLINDRVTLMLKLGFFHSASIAIEILSTEFRNPMQCHLPDLMLEYYNATEGDIGFLNGILTDSYIPKFLAATKQQNIGDSLDETWPKLILLLSTIEQEELATVVLKEYLKELKALPPKEYLNHIICIFNCTDNVCDAKQKDKIATIMKRLQHLAVSCEDGSLEPRHILELHSTLEKELIVTDFSLLLTASLYF